MTFSPPQSNSILRYFRFNQLAYDINFASLKRSLRFIHGEVLDVGCGDKPYQQMIERYCTRYIGIDLPTTLHLQHKIDVHADGCALPFRSNSFDTVLALQVLEHVPEPCQMLKEMHRVLRVSGHLILTTPFMWGLHEEPRDFYRYTKYGLAYLLAKAGFQVLKIEANTGFWTMAGLRLNYHLNRYEGCILRWILRPVYFMVQVIASVADRINWVETDTGSYITIAVKP